MKKFCYIICIFCSFVTSAQDIEVIKIKHEYQLSYISLYHKKTTNYDEIDTSKNISLITKNNSEFRDMIKCNEKKCFPISADEIIVSADFILPNTLKIKDKLADVKPYMKDYLNKLDIIQKVIKKKSGYILYQSELKNVIFVVLKMKKSYYNAHTNNLKLCGNPDENVIVYRFLNGNDEYEIENGTL